MARVSVSSAWKKEEERGVASAPGERQRGHGSPLIVNGAGEAVAWPQWRRHDASGRRAHALHFFYREDGTFAVTPWTISPNYIIYIFGSVYYCFPPLA